MGESVLPCAVPGESTRMFPRHKRKERHLDAYTQTPVQGIQTGTVTAPHGPQVGIMATISSSPLWLLGSFSPLPASGPDSGPLPHFLSWPISLPK